MPIPAADNVEARLLVAAENLLTRAGLSALLEERGCFVLGQVAGEELRHDINLLEPDILVIELGWRAPVMRERLAQIDKDIPVLALIMEDEEASLTPLLGLLRAFPRFALLLTDSDAAAIAAAIAALQQGLTVFDPRLIGALGSLPRPHYPPPSVHLTARENEALQLLAHGLSNRAIAQELGITSHTVKFHVKAIMSKLDAQSRTEAVVRATQLGLVLL